jgi:hypothetical protein
MQTAAVAISMKTTRIVTSSSSPPTRATSAPTPGSAWASGPARLRTPR